MTIVLAGGSGLIGSALKASFGRDEQAVRTLVRRAPSGPDEVRWDPAGGTLDPAALDGADAVICLSGVGVGDHRWTAAYKKQIVDSRVATLSTLARAMAERGSSVVLIAASAVGYYGDTGEAVVPESTPAGSSFLSDVCVQWEQAADPARAAGIRVAHLRTGLVLAAQGGLLKRLKPIVQLGVAGRLGSGRQYTPWISLLDEVRAIRFLIEHEVAGPINLTGPAPVPNSDFMAALGRALHRPTVLPTPGFALKLALGEFADDVLTGQRAIPAALTAAGFGFEHDDVDAALQWALHAPAEH